jgi:hypothetical protein
MMRVSDVKFVPLMVTRVDVSAGARFGDTLVTLGQTNPEGEGVGVDAGNGVAVGPGVGVELGVAVGEAPGEGIGIGVPAGVAAGVAVGVGC